MTSIYKEGTVTVTNGSYIVDGFNTRFKAIADVKPGDLFTVDGSTLYEIYLVESDTRLRIRGLIQGELYNGGNLTGSNYAIIRNFSSDTDATVAANVIALQQKWHRRENEMYGWFNAETEFATVTSIDGEQINVITPYGINALVGGPVNTDEFAFTIDGSSESTDLNAFLNGVYYTIEATLTSQPGDFGAGKKLVFTQADVNGFYQKIMELSTGRQKYRVGVDIESATEWLQVNNGTALTSLEQRVFNNEQALPSKLDTTTFATFSDEINQSIDFADELRQLKTPSEINEGIFKATKSKRKPYASVSAMIADDSIEVGEVVETVSYYDGWAAQLEKPLGGNSYLKTAGQELTEDQGNLIYANDGNSFKGLFEGGTFSPEMFGFIASGESGNSSVADINSKAINNCISSCKKGSVLTLNSSGVVNRPIVINRGYITINFTGEIYASDDFVGDYLVENTFEAEENYFRWPLTIESLILDCRFKTRGLYSISMDHVIWEGVRVERPYGNGVYIDRMRESSIYSLQIINGKHRNRFETPSKWSASENYVEGQRVRVSDPSWEDDVSYQKDSIVTFSGDRFICTEDCLSKQPDTNRGSWKKIPHEDYQCLISNNAKNPQEFNTNAVSASDRLWQKCYQDEACFEISDKYLQGDRSNQITLFSPIIRDCGNKCYVRVDSSKLPNRPVTHLNIIFGHIHGQPVAQANGEIPIPNLQRMIELGYVFNTNIIGSNIRCGDGTDCIGLMVGDGGSTKVSQDTRVKNSVVSGDGDFGVGVMVMPSVSASEASELDVSYIVTGTNSKDNHDPRRTFRKTLTTEQVLRVPENLKGAAGGFNVISPSGYSVARPFSYKIDGEQQPRFDVEVTPTRTKLRFGAGGNLSPDSVIERGSDSTFYFSSPMSVTLPDTDGSEVGGGYKVVAPQEYILSRPFSYKTEGEEQPRFEVEVSPTRTRLKMGAGGSNVPDVNIDRDSSGRLSTDATVRLVNGDYTQPIIFGETRVWYDHTNKVLRSNSSDPTSEDDGDVISGRSLSTSSIGEVKLPSEFSWFQNKIHYTDKGKAEHDIRLSDFIPAIVTTYYVDTVSGSDSNDGLSVSNSLRTLKAALEKSDVDEVVIVREYNTRAQVTGSEITIDRDVIIRPLGKTANLLGADIDSASISSWVPDPNYANAFTRSRSAVRGVWDKKYLDDDGDYTKLVRVSSAALVDSTPNSFYEDGSSVWVRLIDDRTPDEDLLVNLSTSVTLTSNVSPTIYFKNVNFKGMDYARVYSKSGQRITLVGDNVEYAYMANTSAASFGGLTAEGIRSYHFNSKAYHNGKDGFNYHQGEGNLAESFEYNCIGRDNGTTGAGNNNGSTTHDGSTAIRMNCEYYRNEGPNVSDVNVGTISYNVNCRFGDSTKLTTSRDVVPGDNAAMYMIGGECVGGSQFNVLVSGTVGGSFLYHWNFIYDQNKVSGSIENLIEFNPFE